MKSSEKSQRHPRVAILRRVRRRRVFTGIRTIIVSIPSPFPREILTLE